MQINQTIVKPLITEKGTGLAKDRVYMFEVHRLANKNQVRKALEKLYSVKVKKVNVINRKGKTKLVGRTKKLKQLPTKRVAYVSLLKGKIDLFPQA